MTRFKNADDLPGRYRRQALDQLERLPGADAANRAMSEKDWQTRVNGIFRRDGWMVYHTLRSQGSDPGFPDLIAVHPGASSGEHVDLALAMERDEFEAELGKIKLGPGRVIAAELKREDGRASDAQRAWLITFALASVPTYLWRPSDEPQVRRVAAREES